MHDVTSGRPRDSRIDDAVRVATRALLVEVGYQELTFARIAERAGSSRPALYRRWPSKAHLVHDALFPSGPIEDEPPASFEAELRRTIVRMQRSYARPEVRAAMPGLLAELHDPQLRRSVVDGLQQQVRQEFAARVARAIADGEVRAGVDPDAVLDTIIGATSQRALAGRGDDADGSRDAEFAAQLTGLLVRGMAPDPGDGSL